MYEAATQAFFDVFTRFDVWIIVIAAACYGVFVGSIPGLSATMAVALFVPITYWLEPTPALAGIVTMVACAIFAGDIPTTLLRIPGTPASAAYADDAYELARRGGGSNVLRVALTFSVAGGLFGAVVLMLLGSQLARVATMFSVAEYFWLYLLGLSSAVVVSRGPRRKALLGLIIGLLLSTVGLSAVHTQARFTFGLPQLYQGISFIPAMIGLFGVSEVLNNLLQMGSHQQQQSNAAESKDAQTISEASKGTPQGANGFFASPLVLLVRRKVHAFRSGCVGALIGMLPGAGADIAAWVSLALSQRWRTKGTDTSNASRDRAALAGISDATTANSAALAGGWIPTLVFGVPGDSVTAIVIGVLLMKNVAPGPEIFEKQPALVYGIYLIFILANLVLIPVGLLAVKIGSYIVHVSRGVLMPIILLFCVVGSYSLNSSMFDVWVMLAMGLLGFVLERLAIPLGPVVLGIILGGPLEERFIQSLTAAGGSPLGLVDRPVAGLLAVMCTGLWISMAVVSWRSANQNSSTPGT